MKTATDSQDALEAADAELLLRSVMERELASADNAIAWPRGTEEIPDGPPMFRVVYLGSNEAHLDAAALAERLDFLNHTRGRTRRQFRNALAFAVPGGSEIGRVLEQAAALTKQAPREVEQFIAGGRADEPWLEPLRRGLFTAYRTAYLPREAHDYWGKNGFKPVALDPSWSPEARLHDEVMRALAPHLNDSLAPGKLARIIGLGVIDASGITRALFPMANVGRWFFRFPELPRFRTVEPIRRAVAEGVLAGRFGLIRDAGLIALDHLPERLRDRVIFKQPLELEDIRFESGAYLVGPESLE